MTCCNKAHSSSSFTKSWNFASAEWSPNPSLQLLPTLSCAARIATCAAFCNCERSTQLPCAPCRIVWVNASKHERHAPVPPVVWPTVPADLCCPVGSLDDRWDTALSPRMRHRSNAGNGAEAWRCVRARNPAKSGCGTQGICNPYRTNAPTRFHR